MTRLFRASVIAAALMHVPVLLWAQAAADLDILQRGVTLVRGRTTGSGFIVAVAPDRVTVVTARHVIEGFDERPADAVTSSQRPCEIAEERPVTVRFYFDAREYRVSRATCADEDDVAAVEVLFTSTDRIIFPTFREPGRLATARATSMTFLGVPEGRAWGVSVGNVVVSTTDDLITTSGPGVQPGFSGGPVVDTDRGLAGMVIRAGPRTTSVSRSRLDTLIAEWGIKANRLENSASTPPNPAFVKPGPGEFLVEEARNAIRLYRLALTRKAKHALLLIYPSLGESSVDALFGDAVQIELELHGCTDINAENVIQCEYVMAVFRRTGSNEIQRSLEAGPDPAKPAASVRRRPPMKFHLKRGELGWIIEQVTE